MSDLEKIKQLRQSTGAGFKDCNFALKESNGGSYPEGWQSVTVSKAEKGDYNGTLYYDLWFDSYPDNLKCRVWETKNKDGEEVTKVQKKVGDIKKDVESAAVKTQKTVDKLKEGNVTMTKRELSILIESVLKF